MLVEKLRLAGPVGVGRLHLDIYILWYAPGADIEAEIGRANLKAFSTAAGKGVTQDHEEKSTRLLS